MRPDEAFFQPPGLAFLIHAYPRVVTVTILEVFQGAALRAAGQAPACSSASRLPLAGPCILLGRKALALDSLSVAVSLLALCSCFPFLLLF